MIAASILIDVSVGVQQQTNENESYRLQKQFPFLIRKTINSKSQVIICKTQTHVQEKVSFVCKFSKRNLIVL